MTIRCGVGESFPERCPGAARYRARWTNGDELTLCVEHAGWVRANSADLDRMQTIGNSA